MTVLVSVVFLSTFPLGVLVGVVIGYQHALARQSQWLDRQYRVAGRTQGFGRRR
ncbi:MULTISPECIES: hypothetical protein [unclassified Nocardia]|uniref:hypothetical protein n=1 Tax=unclassified Nocardia TaxID=2637762 RepID=UPI00278C3D48|nr:MULTISPECIES: hypothetical protein [unclassified Nocardia]